MMKKTLPSILKVAFLLFPTMIIAQINSVELKDGANASLGLFNGLGTAYAAIPATLTQPYIIEIKNIYTGANEVLPISFVAKSGASAANTITVLPAPNVNTVSLVALSAGNCIISLNDADFIVIDGRPGGTGNRAGLFIENTGTTSNSNTINFVNGATNNIIRYCNLNNGTSGSTGRNISFGVSVSNPTGNSDNTVEYCILTNGRYNINSVGTAANPNTRLKIYGCEIRNIYFAGFWGQAGTGKVIIDSCKIYSIGAIGDGPCGILFDSQTDTVIIRRNQIYNLDNSNRTSFVKGIAIRTSIGTNLAIISNNLVALNATNTGSTNVSGIEFGASATNIVNANIYYNTVKVMGALSTGGSAGNVVSSAFQRTNTVTNVANVFNVYNNIFINERTGGTAGVQHPAMSSISIAGTYNLNYNTYSAAATDFIRWGATSYSTFAAYQPIPGGTNESQSNDELVQFISNTDLHLSGSSLGNNKLNAQPTGDITTDVDGETRSIIFPYRGGDENIASPLPLQFLTFNAHKSASDIVLHWTTTNEVNNRGFDVERSADGIHFTSLGFVQPGGGTGVNTYNFIDKKAASVGGIKQWFYRLKQMDRDNQFKLSPVVSVSMDAIVKVLDISAYPNPFISNIQLQLLSSKSGKAFIIIADINGKNIVTLKQPILEGATILNLPAGAKLPKGTYILRVNFENTNQTIKIIKQ